MKCHRQTTGSMPASFSLRAIADITLDGRLVIDARLGFHARPLDAEAIVRDADLLQRREVLVEMRPAIQRIALVRALPCPIKMSQSGLEIILVARLHRRVFILVTAGGNAPGKLSPEAAGPILPARGAAPRPMGPRGSMGFTQPVMVRHDAIRAANERVS